MVCNCQLKEHREMTAKTGFPCGHSWRGNTFQLIPALEHATTSDFTDAADTYTVCMHRYISTGSTSCSKNHPCGHVSHGAGLPTPEKSLSPVLQTTLPSVTESRRASTTCRGDHTHDSKCMENRSGGQGTDSILGCTSRN